MSRLIYGWEGLCTLIYTGEIKIVSVTDEILWGERELTLTTYVFFPTCDSHEHSDLQSRFRIPEFEKKECGCEYLWSDCLFIAHPSSGAVADLELRLCAYI